MIFYIDVLLDVALREVFTGSKGEKYHNQP